MRSSQRGVWRKIFAASIIILGTWSTAVFAAQNQQIAQKLAALEKLQGKFTFAVLGDNRTGDDVYQKIMALAMERKPAFIVNTGDMIAKPGDKEQWAAFWEMSKPVTVPYFLTIGNHDAHPKVPLSEKTYLEQVDLPGNERYYFFTAGNALFIVLDSYIENEEKRIMAGQLKWLEDVLADSGRKHKFVFLHHPLYTEPGKGHHGGDSLDKYPEMRDRLQALFVKSKVDVVFAGHEHFYQRKMVDTIPHIITGGGGAPLYSKEDEGGFYHFVQVTVDGDTVHAEVIDSNGKVRDRF